MTDLATYFDRGNADPVYLVEFNALKLADGSVEPLCFSNQPAYFADKQFLPCISSLSDLDRAANDTKDPAYLPTWGEISLLIAGTYKPDAGNSLAWNLLLYKDTYTLAGQNLTIKAGASGDAYAAFTTLFSGQIGEVSWNDGELTLSLFDKAQDLETQYPDYELPESEQVVEDSWDQTVPILIGEVKNFTPVLINTASSPYTHKYALACHVIDSVVNAYFNQGPGTTPAQYLFQKTDVSPPKKDTIGGGSALIYCYGPYTGALLRAKWILQIDSITALNSQGSSGPEVGLATFRWKLSGDAAWRGEGLLTWKLAPDTVTKSPAAGNATMTVSGDYTGDAKLTYKVKVTRGGHIGDAIGPQFIWSDDGGVTWQPDDVCTWTPVATAPGVMSVSAYNHGDSVLVEITTGGNVGGAVRFKWSHDGGATWTTNVPIPSTAPITLFAGYSVQFTAPGVPAVDDYDIGDAGGSSSAVDILDTDPIALNRGLSVAFTGALGSGVSTPYATWVPVATAPGVMTVTAGEALDVDVTVTLNGACGVATFDWTIGLSSGSGTTNVASQELVPGYSVAFTAPGIPGTDDYDIGDATGVGYTYTAPFVLGDIWTWTFKEVPIPLEDGVTVQFITQTGQDFYLWDEFSFILMSTILVNLPDTTELTIDAKGLINPATDLFAAGIGEMIYALIRTFPEWEDADFDLASITAFDVAIPWAAGLVVESPESVTSIINNLLSGIPAIYSITIAGQFYLMELQTPSGSYDLTISDSRIMDLPQSKQLPDITKRVYLEYDKNYTTNTSFFVGVSQERLAWLKRGNRSLSRKDDSILTNYPMAADLGPLETALIERADAGELADKLLALYQVPHETVEVPVGLQAVQLDIGQVVLLIRESFGQLSGELYLVIGISISFTDAQSTVTLWR